MEVDGVLPVATLKRKQDTSATGDYFSCLLCQEGDRHNEKLSLASADGKKKIQQAAAERRRLKDRASLTTLNRLMNITDEDWTGVEMKWHKTCYINFASESRLCRLRDRRSKEHAGMLAESSTTTAKFDEQIASSSYGTRKYRHASVEWEHCIFCQRSGKGDLHSVMTMQVSQKIIDLSKEDFVMSVRMANVVDLIAAEGKYHKQCFVEFERRVNKTKERHSRCSDPVLNVLGDILLEGLSVGNMYDMGTAWERYEREQESFPVHVINKTLLPAVVENVLGFHAITGCDTVSSFSGHGKKSCWNVYLQHPELLHGVGRDGLLGDVEKFVCMLYKSPHCGTGVDRARHDLFQKGKKVLEMLPPTSDALELHMSRANYQAKVWLQANKTNVLVPDPEETGGWQATDRRLEVVWLRKPSVPTSCVELVTCGCKSKCRTQACLCHKMGQPCIPACGCDAEGCMNTTGDEAFTGGVQ